MIKPFVKHLIALAKDVTGEHRRKSTSPKLWVFMYHRVLPESDPRYQLEEPGMVVTPATLRMHITEAQKCFTVVSLNDWVAKAKAGESLPEKACAFTFDDGWRDNMEYATPILKELNTPATLFAVVDKIGTDFRFWPNIIAQLMALNSPALAQHAMLKDVYQAAQYGFDRERLAECINNLKVYSEAEIFAVLEEVNWQQALKDQPADLLTWSELENAGFEIGCHTSSHKRLDKGLNSEALRYEIVQSAVNLKAKAPDAQALFCYPNGNYHTEALELVQQNYNAAVTTKTGINRLDQLAWHELTRIPLHEDGSNTPLKFRAKLSAR